MKNLEFFEKKYLEKIKQSKKIPNFNPGDTITVYVKVKEKKRERDQAFEGLCISKKKSGINSSFTVRKISYGEGVERIFPLYSPNISKIDIKTKGNVRRAKLYYLRKLTGRKARISEDRDNLKVKANKTQNNMPAQKKDDNEKNVKKSEKITSDKKETKDNKVKED
tara:strand:+ start:315 stop:812 length:498 start_codon:yes stop_codon:yes gene_type:complete